MGRIFAISDIHGCANTFDFLLSNKIKLKKSDHLYLLGDYIDRGKNSKQVIDIILNLITKGYKVQCLRGNHEQLFIDSERSTDNYKNWKNNCGGKMTLQSFKVDYYDQLANGYKTFFENLPYYFEVKNCILVHAGLNFSNADIFHDSHSMLWIRDMKINGDFLGNRKIIHGHTPRKLDDLIKLVNSSPTFNTLNIDTGCAFKKEFGFGNLTAIELTQMELIFTANID